MTCSTRSIRAGAHLDRVICAGGWVLEADERGQWSVAEGPARP